MATLSRYNNKTWMTKRVWQGWRVYIDSNGDYVLSSISNNYLRAHIDSARLKFYISPTVVNYLVKKEILYWYSPDVAGLHPKHISDKFSTLHHLSSGIRPVHIRNYTTSRGRRILHRLEKFYAPLNTT